MQNGYDVSEKVTNCTGKGKVSKILSMHSFLPFEGIHIKLQTSNSSNLLDENSLIFCFQKTHFQLLNFLTVEQEESKWDYFGLNSKMYNMYIRPGMLIYCMTCRYFA